MELLIAGTIATIFFAVAVPMVVNAIRAVGQDRMRVLAVNAAQDRIEKIHHLAYNQIAADKADPTSTPNFYNPNWSSKEFGPTWTVQTASGERSLTVDYAVSATPATGASAAYKTVQITASWITHASNGDQPHAVTLSTIVYQQYTGPQITRFFVSPVNDQDQVTSSGVRVIVTLNPADLQSMESMTVGTQELLGEVKFTWAMASGGGGDSFTLDYNGTASYVHDWTLPGGAGAPGVYDGIYTFTATAYASTGGAGNTWQVSKRVETGPPQSVSQLKAMGSSTVGGVLLTWIGSASADVDHYLITRTGGDSFTSVSLPRDAAAYTDTTAAPNENYSYTVTTSTRSAILTSNPGQRWLSGSRQLPRQTRRRACRDGKQQQMTTTST